jgi:NADP-dependent 3-hydroxy acid dehydrogenase YdfG
VFCRLVFVVVIAEYTETFATEQNREEHKMTATLDGKRALITGAGGGMGRSHAVLMAERGADIVIHDIKADGAEETAELVRGHGRKADVVVADIRDVAAFTDAVTAAGPVDILVNNAGVGGARRTIEDIDAEIFNQMFEVHVRGTFFATQAVLPGMKENKDGKIVNISSIYAMGGSQLASHYAAAKSAISGFTKSWARELAPQSQRGRTGIYRYGNDQGVEPDREDPRTGTADAVGQVLRADRYFLCRGLARMCRNRSDFRPGHQPQ